MKRLVLLGMTLMLIGLASSASAQTAAQYIAAGNQSYAAKDYAKGVQYYQAATQMDPNSAAAYQGLGNCQYMLGQNSDALAAYEKALNLSPNNAQLSSFVQTLRAKVGASAPAAPAATQSKVIMADAATSESKFQFDVNAGLASGGSGYGLGFGGGVGGYFLLSKSFGLGLTSGFYAFSYTESQAGYGYTASATASVDFLELLASVKYYLDVPGFHPYLLGGGGLGLVMTSFSYSGTVTGYGTAGASASASEADPMIALGAGVEFPMGTNMNFFAQGKYSMVFIPGTVVQTAYGSVTAGGGTSTYLPFEIGLNFDL